MVPNYIEFFDEFRYTDNGKLDRNNLPKDTKFLGDANTDGIEMNHLQTKIADIWSLHLGHNNFGLSDDFFMVGGNSLLLAKIYKDLKETLKIDFPIMKLFKFSTITGIENIILSGDNED